MEVIPREGRIEERDEEDPLAEVRVEGRLRRVILPERFAAAAVEFFLCGSSRPEVIDGGPERRDPYGIDEDQWGIAFSSSYRSCPLEKPEDWRVDHSEGEERKVYLYPRHTVLLRPSDVAGLQYALERVKPERKDVNGVPLPWVPLRVTSERLGVLVEDEEEVEIVPESAAEEFVASEAEAELEAEAAKDDTSPETSRATWIRTRFRELLEFTNLGDVPLRIRRGTVDKHGFVTGRIRKDKRGRVHSIAVTPCPNADRAEIESTLLHEMAHGIVPGASHDQAFKDGLIDLAERAHGVRWFEEARARRKERYAEVDRWITTGIRAALQQALVPRAQVPDDGQTARTVNRVRKLRALASSAPGSEEAITATGLANDLVTRFGLSGYEVLVDGGRDDQHVDRWIAVGRGKVWKRQLMFAVSEFCGVFALAVPSSGHMHLFGKHRDIESTVYLYGVAERHIEESCERHLKRWKARAGRSRQAGDTVRERTSFCDTAVVAFRKKLDGIREEDLSQAQGDPDSPEAQAHCLAARDYERAEEFAREEHDKRGQGWSSTARRSYRHNEEGYAAGLAIDVTHPRTRQGRMLGDGNSGTKALP